MGLLEKIKSFPASPGVYLMKDQNKRIIYVGKAKNLRQRVRQYFGEHDTRAHVQFLMKRLHDLDFLQTNNEKEALLLENSLIKKHKPKYNIFLKDDKTYQGLKITLRHQFPRLENARHVKKDGALYYGPFTSADSCYQVQEFIHDYFQLRTCSDHEFKNRTRPCLEYQIKRCTAPCVKYISEEDYAKQVADVRLFLDGKNKSLKKIVKEKMLKASDQERFEEAARLRDLLESMDKVLEGQKVTRLSFEFVDVLALLREGERLGIAVLMVREGHLIDSKFYVFKSLEDDEELLLNFITQYYTQNSFIPKEIIVPFPFKDKSVIEALLKERSQTKVSLKTAIKGDKKQLMEMALQNLRSHFSKQAQKEIDRQKVLEALMVKLHLSQVPVRMECYDISNISGKDAVGSMVTFLDGEKNKDGYRRFKIKSLETPNDFAMMYEVLSRRFKKRDGKWEWPNLIVIDGGKGQLSQAQKVLAELDVVGVDVVAIAKGKGEGARAKGLWKDKKEEEIYLPNRKNPVVFRPGSHELMILQNIRDESHRFAITYHRRLRDQRTTRSVLDDIPGIGKKRKAELIKKFGSPKAVVKANARELLKVPGITQEIVHLIKNSR